MATSLIEELNKQKGKTVLIGVRSSFFFIGPSEEAISDMKLIGIMAHVCVSLMSQRCIPKSMEKFIGSEDIGNRNVIKTYERDISDEDEVVILIDGNEFGAFWTRDEYLSGRQALIEALGK